MQDFEHLDALLFLCYKSPYFELPLALFLINWSRKIEYNSLRTTTLPFKTQVLSILISISVSIVSMTAQDEITTLVADDPGNTYQLIQDTFFNPNNSSLSHEVPDTYHSPSIEQDDFSVIFDQV